MHVLTVVRNICAHHSRLWNRNLTIQLAGSHLRAIPELQHLGSPRDNLRPRIFGVLCVMTFLLIQIDVEHPRPGPSG